MTATITSRGGRAPPGPNTLPPCARFPARAAAPDARGPTRSRAHARPSGTPARVPPSPSRGVLQCGSVWGAHPTVSASDAIAAHCDRCACSCSYTNRIARSRVSGEYRERLAMTPTAHILESPGIPGQFIVVPTSINQFWSMDAMHDQLRDGRSFRLFKVLDDHNREGLHPDVKRRLANAKLPADIGDGGPALRLAQRIRDLLFTELRFLHGPTPCPVRGAGPSTLRLSSLFSTCPTFLGGRQSEHDCTYEDRVN